MKENKWVHVFSLIKLSPVLESQTSKKRSGSSLVRDITLTHSISKIIYIYTYMHIHIYIYGIYFFLIT